jgi:hypothetical protein
VLHYFTAYDLVTVVRPWASLFLFTNPLLNAVVCMVYFRRLRTTMVDTVQSKLVASIRRLVHQPMLGRRRAYSLPSTAATSCGATAGKWLVEVANNTTPTISVNYCITAAEAPNPRKNTVPY